MRTSELSIGLVHLRPLKKPHDILRGRSGAYTNMLSWASSREEFAAKADQLAKDLSMWVMEVDDCEPLEERRKNSSLAAELEELAAHAEGNPNAILFGTLHTYPHDEA